MSCGGDVNKPMGRAVLDTAAALGFRQAVNALDWVGCSRGHVAALPPLRGWQGSFSH